MDLLREQIRLRQSAMNQVKPNNDDGGIAKTNLASKFDAIESGDEDENSASGSDTD
jgi:hypothetical protein